MRLKKRHFLLLSVLLSEMLASVMSLALNGRITEESLITGGAVSLVVASFLVAVVSRPQKTIFEKDVPPKVADRPTRDMEEVNAGILEENAKRRLAEERIVALIDALPDLIYFKDTESRNLVVNLAFAKLIGISKDEAEGRTDRELLPPALAEHCKRQDEEVIQGGKLMKYVEEHDFHGETLFQETTKVPLYDERGVVTGLVGITRDITAQKRAENAIKKSLREKEVLLQEIHHRVKNNMQIISSLLRLQSRYLKDEEAIRQSAETQNRIRTMALIHEKLYVSRDLANIDFRKYVEDLCVGLKHSMQTKSRAIEIRIDMDDIALAADTAIPCGLIINELVTNAFKYAFPHGRGGKIRISVRRDAPGVISLAVADDGVGIPEGVDIEASGTMGLELIRLLVRQQLSGEMALVRENGTEFRMTLKELSYEPRT